MIPRLKVRSPRLTKPGGLCQAKRFPTFANGARGNSLGRLSRAEAHTTSAQSYARSNTKKRKTNSIRRGPAKHWLSKPAVVVRGEREICNPATAEGRAEYKYRTMLMWVRQDGWCCFHEYDFCPGRLKLSQATFEHQGKRTKGQQDDRISYFDAAGKEQPMNGAAHGECNGIAGSMKLPIFHGTNCSYQEEKPHASRNWKHR